MDKFSRTTELDTAGVLNAIEEDTPKKSRRNNIIALVVCFFVAIFIWAFVVSIDTELYEKKYENVDDRIQEKMYKLIYNKLKENDRRLFGEFYWIRTNYIILKRNTLYQLSQTRF